MKQEVHRGRLTLNHDTMVMSSPAKLERRVAEPLMSSKHLATSRVTSLMADYSQRLLPDKGLRHFVAGAGQQSLHRAA